MCRVAKVTPTTAYLLITHIDGKKRSIEYRALLRASDLGVNILESQFVWDRVEQNTAVEAKVVSYGDAKGIYVCLGQESRRL